jgi:hypothetical protein
MKKKTAIFTVFCLTVIFMTSLLTIDISVTAENVNSAFSSVRALLKAFDVLVDFKAQSVFSSDVEPRVMYHAGVLIAITSWLCFVGVFLAML